MTPRSAVLEAVARRLDQDPEHVLDTLLLVGDLEALPAATDTETLDLARRVNADRLARRRADFRAGALTTADVMQLLGGVTRQAVASRVANGSLLALEIAGRSHFPSWQFGPDGPLAGLPVVLAALREAGHGPLAADALMRTPLPEEGGRSPADLLAAGDADRAAHYARTAGG